MRQAAVTRERKVKKHLPFLLFLILALVSGSFLLWQRQPQEEEPPVVPDMLETLAMEVAAAGSRMENYGLTIEENGPGYKLVFQGQVNGEQIYGKLEDYDLELYAAHGRYFAKSAFTEEWQDLGALGLGDLPALIRTPEQLLAEILAAGAIQVEPGAERTVNGALCQTYFLHLQKPHERLLDGLPQDAVLEKLQVYLWLDAENDFIHRLALTLELAVDGEFVQVSRILQMDPQAKALPAGLPPVEIPGISV